MRVIQVVPAISAESSGPSYSVPGLCRGLKDAGCAVSLFFAGEKPKREFEYPVVCHPLSKFPHPRLGRSPWMREGLLQAASSVDVIHNNSFWMCSNVYPYYAIRRLRRVPGAKVPKFVNSPRGTLAPWALKHHWLQKRIFGFFAGQYAAMRATDMWHATSEKEYWEIRNAGFAQPVAIVPIGMDIPSFEHKVQGQGDANSSRRVVFFGRLHRVKAIDNLVRAWGRLVAPTKGLNADHTGPFPDWELVIAGPDCGVRGDLEKVIQEMRIPRVRFVGELNGHSKYEFLASADLYVLPSLTENFGVTVAEALACGTPVIATEGTPWSGLNEKKAGLWIPIGTDPLVNALQRLMSLDDDERARMGANGKRWISEAYSWIGVGNMMRQAYEWLIAPERMPCPEFVKR